MDVGFHYYVIKLLCLGLGMPEHDARIVANASQHVDDNIQWREIDKGKPTEFPVVATFSIDVTKKKDSRLPTLLIHFPPGDGPDVPGVARNNGTWFDGITTPGASMAKGALDGALKQGNLYQIGVALHSFADTFAHQGFAGCDHPCNKFPGDREFYKEYPLLKSYKMLPTLGHGQAGHLPDWPVTWEDQRRIGDECKINNKERFREAALAIAKKLDKFINPESQKKSRKERIATVVDKIFDAFGEPIPAVKRKDSEIDILAKAQLNDFRLLGLDETFGNDMVEVYDPEKWRKSSLVEEVRGIADDRVAGIFQGVLTSPLQDQYYWQPTYFKEAREKLDASATSTLRRARKTSEKLLHINAGKYFKRFPVGDIPEEWPEEVKSITKTPYFKFHVAAQNHLAHLINETQSRSTEGPKGKTVPLYEYYDHGAVEPWVDAMKKRTLSARHALYGDEE